jgi:cytidyltransferase-like protein
MSIAVYPGTFDPFTRGHEDLVRRASSIFGELVVGIADSKNKKPIFTLEERIQIAKEVLGHYPNVRIEGFGGLLKDLVRKKPPLVPPPSICFVLVLFSTSLFTSRSAENGVQSQNVSLVEYHNSVGW